MIEAQPIAPRTRRSKRVPSRRRLRPLSRPLRSVRRAYRAVPPGLRRSIGVVLALFALVVVVTTVRLVHARNDLLRARSLLQQGNDALLHGSSGPARQYYDEAADALASASRATSFPASILRRVPLVGSPVRALTDADRAGVDVVDGSRILAGAVADFPIHGKSGIRGDHLAPFHDAAQRAQVALAEARPHFVAAHNALNGPAGAFLPWVSSSAVSMRSVVDGGVTRVDRATSAFDIVQRMTAPDSEMRILFVGLDTLEARPGGGYVGSFGILHFSHGTVKLEHYQSFESLHSPTPPLPAPAGLSAATSAPWSIENSMWWPSFPYSARAAADLYARQGGGHVDGVFGMTNATLGQLIGVVGPLDVPGYAPVTGDHFEDRVLYETALKRPLDTPRKKFLTDTSRALFDRLLHLPGPLVPKVVDVMSGGVGRGEVLTWFADSALEDKIADTATAGGVPERDRDMLMISEANVSGSKANRYLQRDVTYEVHRQDDGSYRAKLTIVYHNTGEASEYLNPYYNGYVRLYVPAAAQLDEARSGDFNDMGMAPDAPYRVFAGYVLVQPQSQETVVARWTLPSSVGPGGRYHLSWLWQAGTEADTGTLVAGDHTVTVSDTHRDNEIAVDLTRNPILHWLHDRWVFRKLGL